MKREQFVESIEEHILMELFSPLEIAATLKCPVWIQYLWTNADYVVRLSLEEVNHLLEIVFFNNGIAIEQ